MRLSIETVSAIVTLGLIPVIKFIMKWKRISREKAGRETVAKAVAEALKKEQEKL